MKSIDLAAIDLNLLVAFEALLEQRSVTKAAEELQIGQPAMSAALSRLRVLFEDELFVRLGRQMQPTLKAQTIAPGILAGLQQIRQTVTSSQAFEPISSDRTFALGSSDYTSLVLVPPLLQFSCQTAPSINFRMIGFEKDCVGDLLEQGAIDVALGVFPNPPRQTKWTPIFEERFVGIARQGHPAVKHGTMSLETFADLSHALGTLRRDTTGAIDRALDEHNLERRIALTTPHMMILPFAIASSDLVAAVPRRIALRFATVCNLTIFELPIKTKPWMVSMLWSALSDRDEANYWLRNAIEMISQNVETT
ncbi:MULTISPECIES: LysR family transcriptional regulator [unclassified Microcoleus]|uniref:LysR family transcriptional regulator n=1 Tax=unclassified Microcoleus TaxID=2642155 RepID=UPI001DE00581|nr:MULTISPECIES: LysR family transcriptional regulator [unclassified Microcoleus]MCC3506327.1 LysR family transcriptional regulator [Microcoleus sp. PH2017_19_SFW_U_A]TAE07459.1 MAG: LysR family transcriptional regulator [Oscillatoriales cyanobacterium]MCC3414992.1 LysR family transcriptional regulator [Microcoleus sp. PH2017_02_FOX_O_A]MCC3494163.1 LysR family transcriptional regulator [Microcoleus sp. PH2017_16_JOR_D_A]MCC3519137.1 LysR family transcriptional regulator [Microcoleus sp. PH201